MSHKPYFLTSIALALAVTLLGACAKKKGVGSSGGSAPAAIDPNFEKPVSEASVLSIGRQNLVGTKLVTKNEASTTVDPGLAVFEAELYPKVRTYCASGCHDMNQRPFASDAVPLAYEMAKPFMTANPEDSQMIKNIKAAHNGTDPAWAADVGPAIKKVAEAMQ